MATERPRTLGDLKASGYRSESVKDEMRRNLIAKIRSGEPLFPDILGYEETVVPQVQNAILSRHDMHKGAMILIDSASADAIYAAMPPGLAAFFPQHPIRQDTGADLNALTRRP